MVRAEIAHSEIVMVGGGGGGVGRRKIRIFYFRVYTRPRDGEWYNRERGLNIYSSGSKEKKNRLNIILRNWMENVRALV